jgi:hypothetical protein
MAVQYVNEIEAYAKENDIAIRFVGLFDTVFAVGIATNEVNIGYQTRVPFGISTFHAMSLNERRDAFRLTRQYRWDEEGKRIIEWGRGAHEVWFAGVHSNVGGGYVDTGLSDIALGWMLDNAQMKGLEMDYSRQTLAPNPNGVIRNSHYEFVQSFDPSLRRLVDGVKEREVRYGDDVHRSVFESDMPNPNESLQQKHFFRTRN